MFKGRVAFCHSNIIGVFSGFHCQAVVEKMPYLIEIVAMQGESPAKPSPDCAPDRLPFYGPCSLIHWESMDLTPAMK
jgi:hypothetical protein